MEPSRRVDRNDDLTYIRPSTEQPVLREISMIRALNQLRTITSLPIRIAMSKHRVVKKRMEQNRSRGGGGNRQALPGQRTCHTAEVLLTREKIESAVLSVPRQRTNTILVQAAQNGDDVPDLHRLQGVILQPSSDHQPTLAARRRSLVYHEPRRF